MIQRFGLILALLGTLTSAPVFAQTPESSPLRDASGPTASAHMYFGQSYKAGDSSPGTAFIGALEGGYSLALSPWNRLDVGLEVGSGLLKFETNAGVDAEISLAYSLLARVNYAYAMGEKTMAVLRLGAGLASGSLEGKVANAKVFDEDVDGFAGAVGWDFLLALADQWRLQAGIDMRFFNLNGSTAKAFQVNAPMVHVGLIHTF